MVSSVGRQRGVGVSMHVGGDKIAGRASRAAVVGGVPLAIQQPARLQHFPASVQRDFALLYAQERRLLEGGDGTIIAQKKADGHRLAPMPVKEQRAAKAMLPGDHRFSSLALAPPGLDREKTKVIGGLRSCCTAEQVAHMR